MSVVKLGLTVVMRMQTVSIMRGATLVYVSLDTLEMDSPVLVRHPHTLMNNLPPSMEHTIIQILTSVMKAQIQSVIQMAHAPTLLGVMSVPVQMATVEMVSRALVSMTVRIMYSYLTHNYGTDINECETGVASCSENADCTNTERSYNCSCSVGFTGDGIICTGKFGCMCLFNCNHKVCEVHT